MSEETKRRIFEPFYTTKFTGRGLGMSAILGIVKAHNGTLQLESTQGAGTDFKVYLPLTVVQEQIETVVTIETADETQATTTVLLADDEETLRDIGKVILNTLGFSVITAANGREALEMYQARDSKIDLVMLDLIMPEMGGVEAYHELRKLNAAVPIVICSGYDAESVADVISADEHASFLHKPYNPLELRRVLNQKSGR
jgi:CheY-like chemotaxis protein